MKHDYPDISKEALCRLFGKTRHAYYDRLWRQVDNSLKEDLILQCIQEIRKKLPHVGTRKLHYLLQSKLGEHEFHVGRDYLFELLASYKMLIRQRKRKAVTTDSRHWMHKYANLIEGLAITRPEQLWVSDITYVRIGSHWSYLSLVTDAYSRKIMGFCFRNDLSAQGCVDALEMALVNRCYDDRLIHHSDRGSQYCCKEYVGLLQQSHIAISMTQSSDPLENAQAERVNGIIKEEFDLHSSSLGFEQTYQQIKESISSYNYIRPHSSCNYMTPDQAHGQQEPLKKRWKNYPRFKPSI
ncbi:MAG TPA: IS3 family transposase [Arachidicoccus sp.]|nr:IS3 family transposase [Arachidicoccus sp.]